MQNIGFRRSDTNKGAIINVDDSALAAYKKQRELTKNISDYDSRLKKIEESLQDLKHMLVKLTGSN